MEQILSTGATITVIHFTYQTGEVWRIACMPNLAELHQTLYHPNYPRSNDYRAVTCPQCKKTPIFIETERNSSAK